MCDIALASVGTKISVSTSSDDEHQPEAMIDGRTDTFFVTTGMFPQEVVFSFASLMKVESFGLASCNVHRFVIEKSANSDPSDFEPLLERDLKQANSAIKVSNKNIVIFAKLLFTFAYLLLVVFTYI